MIWTTRLSKTFRMSGFSGVESEGVMNCESCNTRIDYRFLTNCAQCGREVDQARLQQPGAAPKLPSMESGNQTSSWKYHLLNLWYMLTAASVGMISGSVVVYFAAAAIFIAVNDGESSPGESCATGMAIGWLSILAGAFLGTVGGTFLAAKNPICK